MPKIERRQSKSNPIVIYRDNNLTDENIEEMFRSFTIIDTNKDGRISKSELLKAAYMIGMNPTQKDADDMMRLADLDGDGFINFEEYKNMMKEKYISIDIETERLIAAFKVIDKNGDGFISKDELNFTLQHSNPPVSPKDAVYFIEEADINRDGKIDYTEFVKSKLCQKLFQ